MTKNNYIIPFRVLLKKIGVDSETKNGKITLTHDQLLKLIRNLLAATPVDEVWYKKTYPDVQHGIDAGIIKTAKEHYLMDGYFEGRLPGPVTVDEKYYISKYPDVAEGIEFGEIASAQEHFDEHGFTEGRLPYDIAT